MLNDKLLAIIRVLSIALLCVFLYTAVQGALLVTHLRTTMETRLANNEFPLPTGGLNIGGDTTKQESQQSSQLGSNQPAGQLDLSRVPDPDVRNQLQKVAQTCNTTIDACKKELVLMQNVLQQKGFTKLASLDQKIITAIDQKDDSAAKSALDIFIKSIQQGLN